MDRDVDKVWIDDSGILDVLETLKPIWCSAKQTETERNVCNEYNQNSV